jgi:hypothetical protein
MDILPFAAAAMLAMSVTPDGVEESAFQLSASHKVLRAGYASGGSGKGNNYGNPISTLYYTATGSVSEASVKKIFSDGDVHQYQLSFSGDLSDGQMYDSDYYSDYYSDQNNKPTLWSKTRSELGEPSGYMSLSAYFKIEADWLPEYVDMVSWGARFDYSKLTSYGAVLLSNEWGQYTRPVGVDLLPGKPAVDLATVWFSYGYRFQQSKSINEKISYFYDIEILPFSFMYGEDVHFQRSDLSKDPSFLMYGIAMGFDAKVGIEYQVLQGVDIGLVYSYSRQEVIVGNYNSIDADGDRGGMVIHRAYLRSHEAGIQLSVKGMF